MIYFLRKIRQNLLTNKSFRKYLLYAAGEILLVVIGILIALQVNNWNEERKLLNKEIQLLANLDAALAISQDELNRLVEDNERWQSYNLKILDYLDNRKPYDPSLDICFGTYFWTGKAQLTNGAYTQLKNEGLKLISNEALQKEIIYVFERDFNFIKDEQEQWDKDYLANIIYPTHTQLFRKYFPDSTNVFFDEYAKPLDYQALLDNEKFKNIIAENISLRRYGMAFKRNLIRRIDSLSLKINTELDYLKG